MKNIFKWAVAALVISSVASCNDFFPSIPGTQYDLEDTFSDRNKTEEFLNNVYSYVPDETCERWPSYYGGGIWTGGSLEGDITWSSDGEEATGWTMGTAYASTDWIGFWYNRYYMAISKASTFICNVDKCTDASEADRKLWKAQARALRAYYYFNIFRSYA